MAVSNGKIVYQRGTLPSFLCLSPSGWIPNSSQSRLISRPQTASGESKSTNESEKRNEPFRSSDFSWLSISSPAERNRRSKKGRTLSLPGDIDRCEIYCSNFIRLSSRSSCHDEHSITEFSGALTEEEGGSEKSMILTFQRACALRLPVRQSPSQPTVHPDRKPSKPGKFHKDLETLHLKYSSTCRMFSFQEISAATSNFSSGRFQK